MKELLEGFPVVVEIQIQWGEMDAFQHVNNIYYFRYFEIARIMYFDMIRLPEYMKETGIGPILASTSCKYRLPITYPDTISVGAKVTEIAEDRVTMQYRIVSHRHGKVAAEGDGVVVIYNYREAKKTAMPEEIRRRLLGMDKGIQQR